jgi:hypothetical protein
MQRACRDFLCTSAAIRRGRRRSLRCRARRPSTHPSSRACGCPRRRWLGGVRVRTFVKSLNELLGRDRAESLFADERDLIPVDGAVKSNSEPAPPPDIRWSEESVGLSRDKFVLDARCSRTPQVRKPVFVVAIEPQRQELLPYEECWRSVAQLLRNTGKTQANHTESLFDVSVDHQNGH